jgi:uncharacterized protein
MRGYEALIDRILGDYELDPGGVHGIAHWCRVVRYGLELSAHTRADKKIVALFGLLHDSRRLSDGRDDGHGERAAEYASLLAGEGFFRLDPTRLEVLRQACAFHTKGLEPGFSPDATILTCWDADRLDLVRLGRKIDCGMLGTPAAVERVEKGIFLDPGNLLTRDDLLETLSSG